MIAARNFNNRIALTLLELLIVVVILAIAAGLTVPIVQRSFTAQRVEKAGNLVRAGMNRARVRAMKSGDVYSFYYFPNSREYRVAPFRNDVIAQLKSSRSPSNEEVDSGSNFDFGDDRLPQGIVFLNGDVLLDARAEQAIQDNSVSERDLRPVLFYPDGSSQTARILLRCDDSLTQVHLRGMTGTTKLVPVDDSQIRGR